MTAGHSTPDEKDTMKKTDSKKKMSAFKKIAITLAGVAAIGIAANFSSYIFKDAYHTTNDKGWNITVDESTYGLNMHEGNLGTPFTGNITTVELPNGTTIAMYDTDFPVNHLDGKDAINKACAEQIVVYQPEKETRTLIPNDDSKPLAEMNRINELIDKYNLKVLRPALKSMAAASLSVYDDLETIIE